MKRSKKTFLTCLLSLTMVATCGVAVGGLYSNAPSVTAEENATLEVAATHVKTTTLTGQNWEGYVGNDGYLVYAGQDENGTSGKYVYSDLYGATYENKSLYKDNYINTKTEKAGATISLADGAPISLWGVGSETWQYNKDMMNASLATPSGVAYADAVAAKGLCARINNSKGAERAVSTFARVTEDNLYVTVYLMNYGNKKGTFYLDVYKNTIRNADNSNGTISVPATANDTTTVADYFGAENKLESLTIAHNQEGYKAGYFVTFKLEKAGDYQFVAYTDTGVTINFFPSIGGMFFDEVEPFTGGITYELDGGENNAENPARYEYGVGVDELKAPTKEGYKFKGWYDNAEFSGDPVTTISADERDDVTLYAKFVEGVVYSQKGSLVGSDAQTVNQWENTYGKDAYILFGYNDTDKQMAYTKGIYENYTGKVSYTSPEMQTAKTEFAVADKTLSNEFVSRYGVYHNTWNWPSWYIPKDDGTCDAIQPSDDPAKNKDFLTGQLFVPGANATQFDVTKTDEYISGRIIDRDAGAAMFTLTEAAFDQTGCVYVTMYHTQNADGLITCGDLTFETYLFNTYEAATTDTVDAMATTCCVDSGTVVKPNGNGGLYVTYCITEPGDYSIYLSRGYTADQSVSQRGTVQALFFDTTAPSTVNENVVSYVLNGGKNNIMNPDSYTPGTEAKLYDATKEGYKFEGWYTTSKYEEGTKVSKIEATQSGNVVLYAKFVVAPTHTITYVAEGATHENPTTYTEGSLLALAPATKEGYTFEGWYDNAEFNGTAVTEIAKTATTDITLYAKFTKDVVVSNVTYVADGATHSNPATYTEGTALTLTAATKEGYTFDGWYDNADFNGTALTEIAATQTGDVTLYAKFTKNAVVSNVTYVADGATHSNPATYTEGTALTLTAATKEGYTFEGWYDNADFNGTALTEIATTQTGDVTLYAKFVEIDDGSDDSGNTGSSDNSSDTGNTGSSDTQTPGTSSDDEGGSGCGSSIGIGAATFGLLAICGCAGLMIRKKRD